MSAPGRDTLVLSAEEIRSLLPMERCIEVVEDALKVLTRGDALNPLRWAMRLPAGNGILGMMPGAMAEPPTFGLKVVSVMPGNHGTAYDSHQGVVLLFEEEHGVPVAILDASEITAIRTAAATAVATRVLAREDAGDLAILGSGVQARAHLEAMLAVRSLDRVRVFSPRRESREGFAARASERHGMEVESVASARKAVEGADLICTVTSAREPVLEGAWIAEGAHVNAVGSSVPTARELDTEAVLRARLFVDRIESTVNEAGDFIFARDAGAVDESHIQGEVGDILLGRKMGRMAPEEITLFKSLGLAVEDLAPAYWVWERARALGVGTAVALGGAPE